MSVAAHWAVRRFEIFLRTLSLSFPLLAGLFFWRRAWLVGLSMIMFWFLVGSVGQALPHRKQQMVKELASGIPPSIDDGQMSNEISFSLAKGIYGTATIVGSAAAVIAWHEGYRWYGIVSIAMSSYCISFVVPSLLFYRPKSKACSDVRVSGEVGVVNRKTRWKMKILLALLLASVSAYELSWASDIFVGGLLHFYEGSWPITLVVHAVLSSVALLIALMVSPGNGWLSAPFFFFGAMAVFGGIIGQHYDLGVGALMFAQAFVMRRLLTLER
jgi:hypothetical protein